VYYLDLGIVGLGYAGTMSNFSKLAVLIWNIKDDEEISEAITFPTAEAIQDLGSFTTLGLPSLLLLCLQFWSYEFTVFICGIIGVNELSSQVVIF